jgi:triosephosphate isomerase
MKRKKIVAGNWKMNTTLLEATSLAKDVSACAAGEVQKIIFPPFPFLQSLAEHIKGSSLSIGAQNCGEHEKGAFTGEVSAAALKSVGCKYVLVGHSERRTYFSETSAQLKAKVNQVLSHEMNVIYCFGEQLLERKSARHFETVEKQLTEVLKDYPLQEIKSLTLAYEPVWAIGTGETASPEQAQEMHAFVRKVMTGIFSADVADCTSILYGGSCNAGNARSLFSCADVDGGLIGGASLKAAEFCSIIGSF